MSGTLLVKICIVVVTCRRCRRRPVRSVLQQNPGPFHLKKEKFNGLILFPLTFDPDKGQIPRKHY